MAAVEPVATVGVHCCADADIASLLAAGPDVLSIPVDRRLADVAGYLGRFLDGGGLRSPGARCRPTGRSRPADRPGASSASCGASSSSGAATRSLLRQRSLVTPHCGLGTAHAGGGRRVLPPAARGRPAHQRQAVASRFALGA